MLFKLSNLNSNLALTVGYLNPALNNSALEISYTYNTEMSKVYLTTLKKVTTATTNNI